MKIFIDDERLPLSEQSEWVVVRSADAALKIITENQHIITHISFDNDLGDDIKDGYWIMRQMFSGWERDIVVMPELCEIIVHSANVVAANNLMQLARSARPDINVARKSALEFNYPMTE